MMRIWLSCSLRYRDVPMRVPVVPIPATNTRVGADREYVEATVGVPAGRSVLIGSAPFIAPETVCRWAKEVAARSEIWQYDEIGETAQGRPVPVLESPPRPVKIVLSATA